MQPRLAACFLSVALFPFGSVCAQAPAANSALGALAAGGARPREGGIVPAPPARLPGLGISGPGAVHTDRWRQMNEKVTGSAVAAGLIPDLKPLIADTQIRDTIVRQGGDGNYYLTGSSGNDIWDHNDGVELWRSPDLKAWTYVGLVWSFAHDATWEKDWRWHHKPVRALWAPEVHYIRRLHNYFITLSMPPGNRGILRSTTGKPEGPYVNALANDGYLPHGIDATLFEDDDGTVYFTSDGGGTIWEMNADLSGFVGAGHAVAFEKPADGSWTRASVAQEGVSVFKRNGIYYLTGAAFYKGRYSSVAAISDHLYGPYTHWHEAVPCGGGGDYFRDQEGRWWCTVFGNDDQASFREKPAIVEVDFDAAGLIHVAKHQPDFVLAHPSWARAPWVADRGDGTYQNPVLFADYSDPDAVRVGTDYYLTSSSFLAVPGLPILHSRDLVNWTIVGHALSALPPIGHFARPRHGEGVWAPAIRFHGGKYWITYPDPDFGIYLTTATDPAGEWTPPRLILPGRGLIDPCPFWDDDGQLYLIHAWAKSRAGISNLLTLNKLSPDGGQVLDAGTVVVDGNKIPNWTTLEGPKLYKRAGYYYIFAPSGGVGGGYQAVFRARNIAGPYEHRIVLDQGATSINGPHQGAWVDTVTGEDWFLHFQDRGPFGRVVHLEPMVWRDGWPVIGDDPKGTGKGQPFLSHRMPNVGGARPIAVPQTSDDFDAGPLGQQWQWNANPRPEWASLDARPGFLRLACVPAPATRNSGAPARASLYDAPNFLLQKFPAPEFTVTTKLDFALAAPGDRAGLAVYGFDYALVGLERTAAGTRVISVVNRGANRVGAEETVQRGAEAPVGPIYLRVTVSSDAVCEFAYSFDNRTFVSAGQPFTASGDRWIGAKVGLIATAEPAAAAPGAADFDWFRVTPIVPREGWAAQADPFAAAAPLLGWSSWSSTWRDLGGKMNEAYIKAQADAMAAQLKAAGYLSVNLDDGWARSFDEHGRLQADPRKFPSGIAALAEYVHHLGLKLGLYLTPGLRIGAWAANGTVAGTDVRVRDIADVTLPGCTQGKGDGRSYHIDLSRPGAREYVQSYADLVASWGVDYIKMDFVGPGGGNVSADTRAEIAEWHAAIRRTGRPIWLELSNSLSFENVAIWKANSNGWRIENDVENYNRDGRLTRWSKVAARFADAPKWAPYASPGGWNDLDSLEIGNGERDGLTADERQTAMTLWAISCSPLILGADLTQLDGDDRSRLTNPEVLAVDQAGRVATPLSQKSESQVWRALNSDGSAVLALFNLSAAPAEVGAQWSDLGVAGPAAVRDLWTHRELGEFASAFNATLPPHGSRLLTVRPRNSPPLAAKTP
jgi:beta-xylosidase